MTSSGPGLLLCSEPANQVRYQANRACPLYDELAVTFRKTHGAAAMLREALAPRAGRIRAALIFGSVERGMQSAGSDIDLLVAGTACFADRVQALHPAQQALQREVNAVLYSPEEFNARARKSEAFLHDALTGSVVFLMGDRGDLAELAGDPAPAAA